MLYTKHTWRKFKFDRAGFTKTLNRTMGQILRQGARVWLDTILNTVKSSNPDGYTSSTGFPIETGEALASLIPLAQYLHVALSVTPAPGFKSAVSQGISEGKFKIIDDNMSTWRYSFMWDSEVYHFFLNDLFSIKTVVLSPWMGVAAADEAMREYMHDELKRRLPKMYKYIYERDSVSGSFSLTEIID